MQAQMMSTAHPQKDDASLMVNVSRAKLAAEQSNHNLHLSISCCLCVTAFYCLLPCFLRG